MQLTKQLLKRRARRVHRATASQRPDPPQTPDVRVGAPEDKALYTCVCGHAFKASVTTSVECPRCRTEQPW
jgi:hypothetical protein